MTQLELRCKMYSSRPAQSKRLISDLAKGDGLGAGPLCGLERQEGGMGPIPQGRQWGPTGFHLYMSHDTPMDAESPAEVGACWGVIRPPVPESPVVSVSSLPVPSCHMSQLRCQQTRAPLLGPCLSVSHFPLQLALRGPAGPMGLTGRPGPVVSHWQI